MSIPMCRLGEPVSRPDKWENEWVWGKETGLWHKNLHYGVEPERPEHPVVTLADHLKKAGLTWEELAEKSGRSLEWLLSINDGEPFGASSAKPLAEPLGIHERHLIELAAANQERARRIVRKRGKSATDLALASGVPETRVMQFLAGCAIPVSNVRALLSEPTVNGEGPGDFGKWVRERRLELGMSAHALSKAANVSAVTVANVEKGLPYHGLTRRKIERVLSDLLRVAFTQGDCQFLAEELVARLGLELAFVGEPDGDPWCHAVAFHRESGKYLDITGVHTAESLYAMWEDHPTEPSGVYVDEGQIEPIMRERYWPTAPLDDAVAVVLDYARSAGLKGLT